MEIRKQISVLLCCVAFIRLSTSAFPMTSPKVGYEVLALMNIKNLLVDPHGVLDKWDESVSDPSSWPMVTCSPDGLVAGLDCIAGQDLSGTFAPTIGNLTNIQLLENNNISGEIPFEIGSLSKLQTLDLCNNTFSGQIPCTFSHLKSLRRLRLTNNRLSGEITASLADLTQLNLVDLSFNNLSGQVPKFPVKIFNIEGNPYICSNGAEKVGCADMNTGFLSSSSKAKLNYPSLGIYKFRNFFVILIIFWFLILEVFSTINLPLGCSFHNLCSGCYENLTIGSN